MYVIEEIGRSRDYRREGRKKKKRMRRMRSLPIYTEQRNGVRKEERNEKISLSLSLSITLTILCDTAVQRRGGGVAGGEGESSLWSL